MRVKFQDLQRIKDSGWLPAEKKVSGLRVHSALAPRQRPLRAMVVPCKRVTQKEVAPSKPFLAEKLPNGHRTSDA